jgi:glycosyltransferase involved in cell wall biosynthesis
MSELTVLMSVYNIGNGVPKRAIDSILNQSLCDFEFIIVNDNPLNPELTELLNEYEKKDKRIKLIFNDKNLGVSLSKNKGIKSASGKYIAIMDSDDVAAHDRLKIQYQFLADNQEVDAVGSAIEYFDENLNKTIFIRKYNFQVKDEIRQFSPMAHPSLMIKKDLYYLYGFYEPDLHAAEDYSIIFKWYINNCKLFNLPEVLIRYYQSSGNIKSTKTKDTIRNTLKVKKKYKKIIKFSLADNVRMLLEQSLIYLPAGMIIKLFYIFNKMKK